MTHPAPCCKEIRVTPKIRLLPSGTLSRMLDLRNFATVGWSRSSLGDVNKSIKTVYDRLYSSHLRGQNFARASRSSLGVASKAHPRTEARGLLITPGRSTGRAAIHSPGSLLGLRVCPFIVASNIAHFVCGRFEAHEADDKISAYIGQHRAVNLRRLALVCL